MSASTSSGRPEARPTGAAAAAASGAGAGERRGLPPPLPAAVVDPLVRAALAEDQGAGDLPRLATVPAGRRARGRLVAKQAGRLAGLEVFARVFELCDAGARIERLAADGDALAPGQLLCRIEGDARALLLAERTALNFVQRLSGIATLSARYVALAAGRARVLDTRKTTPGLRALEKHAVRCGGGENHRFGLFDELLVKDNHIDLAGEPLERLLPRVRAEVGPQLRITAEARGEAEARAAIAGGADVVLLDNLDAAALRRLCPLLRECARARGRAVELEASGGITEANLAEIAASGVDRVSIGALTHSAPALDLSFKLEVLA